MSTQHQPLHITAQLATGLSCYHPIALDALLAAQVAGREDYPPPSLQGSKLIELRLDDVLQWHSEGFYCASQAHLVVQGYNTIRWSKKTPSLVNLAWATSANKCPLGGRWKAYWMPLRTVLPAGMRLHWWALGDLRGVAELLVSVFGLGGKRNVGHGNVAQWTVAPWHEDWSLLRPEHGAEGGELVPARPLPLELAPPGWMEMRICRRHYPYWRRDGQELLAVPPEPRDIEDENEDEEW